MKLKTGFQMMTASNQPIVIDKSDPQDVFVFNLPPTGRDLVDPKYEERAITSGVRLCVYGKMLGSGKMIPELIIGNQQ